MITHNYRESSWISPKLGVRESPIQGQGVFTSEPIARDEVVIIWGGAVFSAEEVSQGSGKRHTLVGIAEDLYLGIPDNAEFTIDDFMNHSCNPNIGMCDEVTLVAKRDVKAGEELTADYSMWLNDANYQMKQNCNCRNHNCRKQITGADWKLACVQEENEGYFSPFVRERIRRFNESSNNRS